MSEAEPRAVKSIAFHFLWQTLGLCLELLSDLRAFFTKYFALLLHHMNLRPRYKHGSADYKRKLFSVKLCFSFLASVGHRHTLSHVV